MVIGKTDVVGCERRDFVVLAARNPHSSASSLSLRSVLVVLSALLAHRSSMPRHDDINNHIYVGFAGRVDCYSVYRPPSVVMLLVESLMISPSLARSLMLSLSYWTWGCLHRVSFIWETLLQYCCSINSTTLNCNHRYRNNLARAKLVSIFSQ